MHADVLSALDVGADGVLIDVECQLSNGLPGIVIVGFANKAVDEAKERIRAAFTNSNLDLPRKRITINLAPADLPKDGSSFDLAVAVAILCASKQVRIDRVNGVGFIGELGLDGTIRPVRGIIGKLLAGKRNGVTAFFVPEANLQQATLVPGIELYAANSLKTVFDLLATTTSTTPIKTSVDTDTPQEAFPSHLPTGAVLFEDIIGQLRAKRALAIVAAGGHNVLLNGPPGTGKSMLAKALPTILPPMNHTETLEVTHLHSLATSQYDKIITTRPFRSPHHSASDVAITGGGHNLRPGDISLSHRGVLFFDEFPEFGRSVIEALRQPLEDHTITISRAKDSVTYPANFVLVATANPCPCGYYGTAKPCQCLPHEIARYQRKLSGPILDRIDMHIDVEPVEHAKLLTHKQAKGSTSTPEIQKRILLARRMQYKRFGNTHKLNSDMTNRDIRMLVKLSDEAKTLLDKAAEALDISARSYMRTIRVARTIADLENSDGVLPSHITEALQYRSQPKTSL